jgi:hypothetical protein
MVYPPAANTPGGQVLQGVKKPAATWGSFSLISLPGSFIPEGKGNRFRSSDEPAVKRTHVCFSDSEPIPRLKPRGISPGQLPDHGGPSGRRNIA